MKARRLLPVLVALIYAVAFIIAFPPFNQPWAVLVFLVPFIKWAFALPRWRTFLLTGFLAGWAGWFGLLIWLRHIYPPWGWVGLALLSATLGLFILAWLAALRWAAPRLINTSRGRRVVALFALAGWWVVLDWVRGWILTGFLWLPLAAAFWKFPLFLQLAEWTGAWGITFLIVLFNLGLVCGTGPEKLVSAEEIKQRRIRWPARIGAEILVPIILFSATIFLTLRLMGSKGRLEQPLLRVGLVQPWTPPWLKWDSTEQAETWRTLEKLSAPFILNETANRVEGPSNVDLIMWPEAAPPYFVEGAQTGSFRKVLNQFSTNLGRPILLGAVGESLPRFGQTVSPGLLDGVFLVRPGAGIADEVYAKRHLVPFGEYNPLRTWLPFLGKVVPLDEDTVPGTQAVTIPLNLSSGHTVQIGPLVCYEDVFPNLARDEAKAGADFLAVVTNDAWYGTGGGALQHAAHSVLRAIETRRPVVRCGNDGWSGFIDQDGDAFELEKVGHQIKTDWVLTAQGTTYFRGSGPLYVYTNHQFDGKQTFYVRYGDWFVGLSALLALAGVLAIRKWQRLD
jgi:apolipoprotein N-acyltransferase